MKKLILLVLGICMSLGSINFAWGGDDSLNYDKEYLSNSSNSLKFEIRKKKFEKKTSDGIVFYTRNYEYPYFFGESDIEKQWNQKINSEIKEIEEEYKKCTQSDIDSNYKKIMEYTRLSALPLYDNMIAKVKYNKNGYLSILVTNSMWGGGAHPYHSNEGYMYDVLNKKELKYNDVLNGTDKEIIDCFIKESEKSYEDNPNLSVKLSDIIYNDEYFFNNSIILNDDGICIYLNVGGAMPKLMMTIPYYKENLYKITGINSGSDNITKQVSNVVPDTKITVLLNGNELTFEQPPYIENGSTRVPMRKIFESLGATVEYDADTKTITARKGSTVIELVTGKSKAKINGREMTLTTSVENKNGSTMVPLRFVSEALGAEVIWDSENKIITINLLEEEHNMFFVASDTSLSFKVNENIKFGVGLDGAGVLENELKSIRMTIDDMSKVTPVDAKVENGIKYFYLKAMDVGTSNIYIENPNTGEKAEFKVLINENKMYKIDEPPKLTVDNNNVTIYNFNGITIDNYKVSKLNNGSCDVSFNAYNTRYIYGIIEIFDNKDNLISFIPIQKQENKATSIKGALIDNFKDIYSDIVDGTLLTYKQKSGYSAETKNIKFNVPKNGYFKITTDFKQSGVLSVLNSMDIILQIKSITGKVKDDVLETNFGENIVDKIDTKKFIELYNKNLFKNKDKFIKDISENVIKDVIYSPDGIGRVYDNIYHIMNNYDFDSTLINSISNPTINITEDIFIENAGIAGAGLKVIFYSSEAENIILGITHMVNSSDSGMITFQN